MAYRLITAFVMLEGSVQWSTTSEYYSCPGLCDVEGGVSQPPYEGGLAGGVITQVLTQ